MTCSAYERDVLRVWVTLEGEGIELAEVKVTHLRAFLASEHERTPAVSRQARTTAALKCFFRFLVEEDSPGASAAPCCSPGSTKCARVQAATGDLDRAVIEERSPLPSPASRASRPA